MGGDAGVIHFSRELVYNCIVYTIAAANEYWLIDWMSSLYGIRLPVLCAMLQNASWPIQLVLYYYQRKAWEKENGERVITRDMYKSYIILGGLNTIISITRTVGLTSLPPTLYVIIANTEIIFEVMMSRFLLGKPANRLQRIAIVLVMAGVLIALYDPVNHRFGSNQSVSQTTLLVGVFLSLLSRFTSALNTVLADKFLGKDRKTRLGVLECSFFNAVIPSFLLPGVLAVVPEYQKWTSLTGRGPSATAVITILCAGLTAAKHTDRLSKFFIVSRASTIFFAFVDSNMKIIAGIGTFIFFNQAVYWTDVVGFVCIFLALLVACYDKKLKYDQDKAAAAQGESEDKMGTELATVKSPLPGQDRVSSSASVTDEGDNGTDVESTTATSETAAD